MAPVSLSAILAEVGSGNQPAKANLDAATPAVYQELKRLARMYLSGERSGHTLQPTALVHEAYLRLAGQRQADFGNKAQFVGLAASMMRRVLLDHAKARKAAKRGGAPAPITLEARLAVTEAPAVDLLDLDRALERLAALDPRLVSIVEMRFFGGLSIEETAEVLNVGVATVSRDWTAARLFLTRELHG